MNKSPNIRITISYGYDIHSLILLTSDFEKIKNGACIDIDGQGFSIEGNVSQDTWSFKNKQISVTCENGFDVFQGSLVDIISTENVVLNDITITRI